MPAGKIRVLLTAAGLHFGGAEIVIRHLVKSIDSRRFDVSVCCIKDLGAIGEELVREGFDVVTLPKSRTRSGRYLTFIKLLKLIRQRNVDVVHTHTTDALADAALCRLVFPRFRLVHTFHFGNYPFASRQKLRIERAFARFADQLIAVGNVQREQIAATFELPKDLIARVWNGIPSGPTESNGTLRASLGATDRVIIGTIATLIPQKGLADLLIVASRLKQSNSKALFVVVGDGALRRELEAERDRLGLQDTVLFAGWVKNAARTALPDFDVFFQPSLWEAMSIAVLEAMAAGKPVVATRVGENPLVIEHGKDGLLVEPRDIDEMTAVLVKLSSDPATRLRLGSAAATRVARDFSVAQMARAYEAVYANALGPRH